jgi:2-polyprenyl-3-methyl-5-hydroxy-6-metoxy-1,4-benzoquinol methylase
MPERHPTDKELAYDSIATTWHKVISGYDTDRRIETLIYEWLQPDRVAKSRVWEVGCGLGQFTDALLRLRPCELLTSDIAPRLVADLAKRLPTVECKVVDVLASQPALGDRKFDIVLSSEVIEHTPDPHKAVFELCRRVAPGGLLVISCPNQRWIWLLHLAQRLGLRKHYQGFENWVRPEQLTAWIGEAGLRIVKAEGVHLLPWHVMPKFLLRAIDRRLRSVSYGRAINLAVLAERPNA